MRPARPRLLLPLPNLQPMVLAVISITAAATINPTPEQTIIQKVETTGDVKRLCVEARTGEHIEAMSCELIDQQSGGVMR